VPDARIRRQVGICHNSRFVDRSEFDCTPDCHSPHRELVNTRWCGASADHWDSPTFVPGFERDEVQWNLLLRNDVVFDLDYGGRFNWCDHADELQESQGGDDAS
jgi:hypothetical protein